MGSSIGSDKKSGTLGGYVTVLYQGKTHVMGLTSHNVIATHEMMDRNFPHLSAYFVACVLK